MTYDPTKHHRRSIRLQSYDYSWPGAYFITLCVREKECVLGDIVDGEMRLSEIGQIVTEAWLWLAERYPHLELDEWTIMPNHLHGIIVLAYDDRRGGSRSVLQGDSRISPTDRGKPLGQLIGAFKTVSTKRINALRGTPGVPFWQRNYWEHVIRDEIDLNRIRQYIENNPRHWHEDQLNPIVPPRPTKR